MNRGSETVVVAMSGGVDSSVAAALLQRQGYRVVGMTLLMRPCEDDGRVKWCCGVGAAEQARAVADRLGFPHYAVDCAAQFESTVLRAAWDEYARGRTPSPCIHCNREIKFGFLLDEARKLGASKIATGHYSRLRPDECGGFELLRGRDPGKDQSYFLYALNRDQLGATLFPLGEMRKPEVRRIAAELGLENADRPESQDACFSHPEGGFAEGLRVRFDGSADGGRVVDPHGRVLGRHDGIHRYTVGQRKGLRIALGTRAYVARIDASKATVVLSEDLDDITSHRLWASGFQWTGDRMPVLPLRCGAQIRYRHQPVSATACIRSVGVVEVEFDEPQRAVAPGQAVVLFDGERVLGGGWIDDCSAHERLRGLEDKF